MKNNTKKKIPIKSSEQTIEIKLIPGNYPRVKELSLKIIECFENYSEEEVTYALANVDSFRLFSNMDDLVALKLKGLL